MKKQCKQNAKKQQKKEAEKRKEENQDSIKCAKGVALRVARS